MGALAGTRIIELAETPAGEYCARLLADFGAEVIKIERAGAGSPTRRMAPLVEDEKGNTVSGLFTYLNTNKQSLALALESAEDRSRLDELIASADAIIDDHPPAWLQAAGLSPARLATEFPGVIFTAVTPFGADAADNQWHAKSLNVFHESGWGYHTPTAPDTDKPPLKGPGRFLADYEGALDAALCTVSALYWRRHRGDGLCHIDVSQRDALLSRADLVVGRMLLGVDEPGHHRTAYDQPGPCAFFPCDDGAVYLYLTNQKHWRGLQELMGHPEWMENYDENWLEFGVTPELVAHFQDGFRQWVKDKQKVPIAEAAQRLGVPIVPVNNARDVHESPQYIHREFFKPLVDPALGELLYPTLPCTFSASPVMLNSPAPALNQHDPAIFGEHRESRPPAEVETSSHNRSGPLAGIRVVEITKVWAGPFAGKLLALLGAEVIKVESHTNLDELRAFGGVDINHAPFFLSVNQEVLSIQANLKSDEGLALVRDLIAKSDIVIDNLRPGAMEKLGLGYDGLRNIKTDIIVASIKMYGSDGPLGHQTGYAPCFTALGGLSDLVGFEPGNPLGINMRYGDATVGAFTALSSVVALNHRQRTGEGQFLDVSAVECMSAMVGDSLLEYSLTGKVPEAEGNRHPEMAPHGCYPCLEKEWISIAVDSEHQWRRLCDILGKPELANDPRFNDTTRRLANAERIDAELAPLTSGHSASVLAERLLEEGIGAAKSMSSIDLLGNHDLWQREIFRFVDDENSDKRPVVGIGWKIEGCTTPIKRGAPLLGEHNDYVYGEILGLSPESIQALIEAKAIY